MVQSDATDLLVIGDDASGVLVDRFCEKMTSATSINVIRRSQDVLPSLLESRPQAIGVVLFVADLSVLPDDLCRALTRKLTPLPLIVVTPDTSENEFRLLSCGVDDCLDARLTDAAVIVRVVNRSIERARQRVHVATAEQQYRDLFDHMPIASFSVDRDGCIADANRTFLAFMGAVKHSDVSDEQLNGLLAGLCKLQQISGCNAPVYKDTHIIETLNGTQKHVVVYARQHGEQPLMDVYLTDITEQETQTRRVAAAENRLRHVYDNVPVMMFTLDKKHRLRDVNRTFAERAGLTAAVLERFPIDNLLHPDFVKAPLKDALHKLFDGISVNDLPVDLLKSDGACMECLFSASPLLDETGEIRGAHAMMVDVTDRNNAQRERDQLQEQLQLTQKLESIGELAAGIAHEINTPAQYVSDNLSFLLESFNDLRGILDALPDTITAVAALAEGKQIANTMQGAVDDADLDYLLEEIPTALEQGKHGIQKIREIVLALKDFSHPGSGDAELADLNRIIDSTVTVARNEWKYVADLKFGLAEDLPLVECFPSAIAQVVLNIVVNAAHAISDSRAPGDESLGQICINTALADDDHVEILISDNGPGIPEDIQRKVFDPFFTTKEVGRGTGQGLAISRTVITEQHNGRITLDSAKDRGTTFRIEIPLRSKKQNGLSEEAA